MAKQKRPYKKRNTEYWENLGKRRAESSDPLFAKVAPEITEDFEPAMCGEPLISFDSTASGGRLSEPNARTSSRTNRVTKETIGQRFNNINEGLVPFQVAGNSVNVTEAILLCQKAYYNVPVFKSTLDLLAEFSDAHTYMEGGSVSSRNFVKAWFKKINLDNLKDQYFREYYRGSNVFMYRLDSQLKQETVKNFKLKDNSVLKRVPVKYIILNPTDIVVNGQLSFGKFQYAKALTPFEVERLRNATTDEEKYIYESLDKDVKDQLKEHSAIQTGNQVLLELDPKSFHVVFYKKQDYEPLAVPLGFSVLDDINKKLELKKVDQAIARSVENVILLVTMGTEPDKGGINHNNLAAMRQIFENKSVGRVLVSDYTTQAEFVLPDLTLIMGEAKYEVLNKDIQEGLGNILIGESKYSDTELKLKLFFQRLEKGKEQFLREFLQPEVDRLCKEFGFRKIPQIHFQKEDVINSEKLQKLVIRMMELGVLTPEQGIDTIHKGEFPAVDTMKEAQLELREEKLEGLYAPLTASQNFFDPMAENDAIKLCEQMELEMQQMQREGVPRPDPSDPNAPLKKEPKEPTGRPSDGGGRGGDPQDKNRGGGRRSGTYVDRIGRRRRYPRRRTPTSQSPNSPTVSAPSGGRPVGQASEVYSSDALVELCFDIRKFQDRSVEKYKELKASDELSEEQEKMIGDLCLKVVKSFEIPEWDDAFASTVKDINRLKVMHTQPIIIEIAEAHQLDDYSAALLYHTIPVIEDE